MADTGQLVGSTLLHYRIEAELGRGGMGEVYVAYDSKLQRRVALKLLPTADPDRLRRFEREAQAVAALNHPNVVTIFSVEESDGLHFLTMELIDGQPLSQVIQPPGMALLPLLDVAVPIIDGVAAAHQRGVVHRDLKPGNIMLTSTGRVKVLDFGLAKLRVGDSDIADSALTTDQMLTGHHLVGTPAYMSPEQAEGKRVDARSDIFSLGVILYELATARRPFVGATTVSLLSSIIKDTPPAIPEIRPELPAELDRIIRRCLAKDPTRRYQNAYDLRNDLEDLRESSTGSAARPVPRRGFRAMRWVAAVLFLAAAITTLVLYLRERGSSDPIHANFSQITSLPGLEWFPSLSPDGKWVIYSGEHGDDREIYLQSLTGQTQINLTNDPAEDDQPVFSPDGERIAFRSTRDGGGVFIMGRTGEAVRKIIDKGFNPSWSPDGKQLVFATHKMELSPQNSEGRSELWIVDVESGQSRRLDLPDGVQPNWSPNNRRIAYAMRLLEARRTAIWTVPVDGGPPSEVTSEAVTDWNPVWSPDGKFLYFSSDRGGSMNLWRVAMNEKTGKPRGAPQPIPTPAPFLAHISVARDGKSLVYSSTLIRQNIQKLPLDPKTLRVIGLPFDVTSGTRLWSSPDPSPDGSSVVFYSRVQPEGDLYVIRSDGSGFRQITTDAAIDRVARWSSDGQWIATFSDRGGPVQIWKLRPDGSGLQQITHSSGDVAMPVWSPDGRWMAVSSVPEAEQGVTFLFNPNQPWNVQKPEELPPLQSPRGFVVNSWSADGTRLAGQDGFTQGILTYNLSTRAYERVVDFGEWPVWLPDNRHILFVSKGKTFHVVDTRTRDVRELFSVPRHILGPPRLTRDGSQAFYSRRSTDGDIWLATLQ